MGRGNYSRGNDRGGDAHGGGRVKYDYEGLATLLVNTKMIVHMAMMSERLTD